jgi:hypothetical protein
MFLILSPFSRGIGFQPLTWETRAGCPCHGARVRVGSREQAWFAAAERRNVLARRREPLGPVSRNPDIAAERRHRPWRTWLSRMALSPWQSIQARINCHDDKAYGRVAGSVTTAERVARERNDTTGERLRSRCG